VSAEKYSIGLCQHKNIFKKYNNKWFVEEKMEKKKKRSVFEGTSRI